MPPIPPRSCAICSTDFDGKEVAAAVRTPRWVRYPGSVRIADLGPEELLDLVEQGDLDELQVLDVLRNSYCSVEVARVVANNRAWLSSHLVRERLAGFRGLPVGTALNLLPTLPWLSLLHVAQSPKVPPAVRRHAERQLLVRLQRMALGEKIALARMAHRPLFRPLLDLPDAQVHEALLDNPKTVENDVVLMLARLEQGSGLFPIILRHRRWGASYAVKRAIARAPRAPLPLALSSLVHLKKPDLEDIVGTGSAVPEVRAAAQALLERGVSEAREGTEVTGE